MLGKEKFIFKSFLKQAEEQLLFRNTLLGSKMITFSLYFSISLSKLLWSPLKEDLPSYI